MLKKILEVAIGFLSSTGGDIVIPGEEFLSDYVTITLMLKEGLNLGNTVEKHVKLKHIVSLWEFLEDQLNADPFEKVLPKYRSELDEYLERDLIETAQHLDLEVFLPIMKEMILDYFCEGMGNIGAKIKLKDTMSHVLIEGDVYLGTKEWFKLFFPAHIECSHTLAVYRKLHSLSVNNN